MKLKPTPNPFTEKEMKEHEQRRLDDLERDRELKRKFISDIAKKGAKKRKHRDEPSHGKMCSTCAFKFDSEANNEPHNVEGAFHAISFGGTFNCHVNDYDDAGKPCVGFLNCKELLK